MRTTTASWCWLSLVLRLPSGRAGLEGGRLACTGPAHQAMRTAFAGALSLWRVATLSMASERPGPLDLNARVRLCSLLENGSGVCAAVISGSDRLCHTSNSVADVVARTMPFWSGEPAQYFWFSAWCTASKFVLALLGLVLADGVRRPVDVIRGATIFCSCNRRSGCRGFSLWIPCGFSP